MNKYIREFFIVSPRLTKRLELGVSTVVWVWIQNCLHHECWHCVFLWLVNLLLFITWTQFFSSIPLWNLPICWFEVLLLRGDETPRPWRAQEKNFGETCMRICCRFIGPDLYLPAWCCQEANAGNECTSKFNLLGIQISMFDIMVATDGCHFNRFNGSCRQTV